MSTDTSDGHRQASSPKGLVTAVDLTASSDYGQFYIQGRLITGDEIPGLVDETINNHLGVASNGSLIVVASPHQNNFAMPLRVEVWDRAPDDDAGAWQQIVEASLVVDTRQLLISDPTGPGVAAAVPDGDYRVRICGRGFVAYGWPGSTTPGDSWRVQLWPESETRPPSLLKRWPGPRN